ncbi:MAG: hypothetical protein GC164_12350 [Phycisphaera sp.]|nr:hypothetical protein [Phycisphaera sp.]
MFQSSLRWSFLALALLAGAALSVPSYAGAGCGSCEKKDQHKCAENCANCEKCKDGCKECCKDAESCKACCGDKSEKKESPAT